MASLAEVAESKWHAALDLRAIAQANFDALTTPTRASIPKISTAATAMRAADRAVTVAWREYIATFVYLGRQHETY